MSPREIIEQCADNGLTLAVTVDGSLDVVGAEDWIEIWSPILRKNKAGIVAELHAQSHLEELLFDTEKKYSVLVTDASTDPVLVKVGIKGIATFDLDVVSHNVIHI